MAYKPKKYVYIVRSHPGDTSIGTFAKKSHALKYARLYRESAVCSTWVERHLIIYDMDERSEVKIYGAEEGLRQTA